VYIQPHTTSVWHFSGLSGLDGGCGGIKIKTTPMSALLFVAAFYCLFFYAAL